MTTAADRLAAAVRTWRDNPTTANGEALGEALDIYDRAKQARPVNGGPGPIHVQVDQPAPPVVYVPVPDPRMRR